MEVAKAKWTTKEGRIAQARATIEASEINKAYKETKTIEGVETVGTPREAEVVKAQGARDDRDIKRVHRESKNQAEAKVCDGGPTKISKVGRTARSEHDKRRQERDEPTKSDGAKREVGG